MSADEQPGRDVRPGTDPDAKDNEPARSIDSTVLFGGAREIVIRHGESEYRLRATSKGRLLLTK